MKNELKTQIDVSPKKIGKWLTHSQKYTSPLAVREIQINHDIVLHTDCDSSYF